MTIKEKIKNVIGRHNLVHIATINDNGMPNVRGVDYAPGDEDNVLYFATLKNSQKIKEISANPSVSIVIDHDCPDMPALMKLVYIRAKAKATVVEDLVEIQNAMGKLMERFPFLKDLPGEPTDYCVVKIEFKEVAIIDNTVSFAYTETIFY